ncbi:unnamed protein product [Bursaphelenchus xylophilus]|uniref:(pine wood nematode) hypothetical protein n=1 Tax=Bursaphelenchus xylophilus TaxID=6326 RepID=A0A811LFM8_BURXY|nr:unnamed protein product [Bursaphelenchus xylophilus]CAG9115908.1 unnamed protein product [Bursaphelenchus xylophilus]
MSVFSQNKEDNFGFDQSDEEDECEQEPTSSKDKSMQVSRPKRASIELETSINKVDEYDFSSHAKKVKKEEVPSLRSFKRNQSQVIITKSGSSYSHKWGDRGVADQEYGVQKSETGSNISYKSRPRTDRTQEAVGRLSGPLGVGSSGAGDGEFKVPTLPARIRTGSTSASLDQQEQDDFNYFMETLERRKVELRLKELSFNGLVTRCVSYRFRNYLRTHVLAFDRIVAVMKDNKDSPEIVLLGAVMFYIMSRDRNDFPKNKFVMSILVDLIKRGNINENDECKKRAWAIIESWRSKIKRKSTCDFEESTMNSENVAIVTLDYLACRNGARNNQVHDGLRAGGAFPFLVEKVHSVINTLISMKDGPANELFYHFSQLEHLFRIHELLFMNREVQTTITGIKNGQFFYAIERFVDFFVIVIDRDDIRERVIQTFLLAMRSTLNACIKNAICIERLGGIGLFMQNTVIILCDVISKFDSEKFHDIRTLLACILIVLAEPSSRNKKKLMNMRVKVYEKQISVMKALAEVYNEHEAKASEYDEKLNEKFMEEIPFENSGEEEDVEVEERDEEEDLSPEEILHRINRATKGVDKEEMANAYATVMEMAECHMNDSFVASYVALLLGVLINNNREIGEQVKQFMTSKNFASIIDQLRRFNDFSKLSKIYEITNIENVIKTYEAFNEDD